MFKIIQGHQITDEEIYQTEGNIPVLTGKNVIKGFWNNTLIEETDLPCITYPTKANSGEAYVQNSIFDANNTAILIPLPEWRGKIILEWLAFKLPSIFLNVQTSKEGVSYLNREIVQEVEIEIPNKPTQEKELNYYRKLQSSGEKLDKILGKIKKAFEQSLVVNSDLTEEIELSSVLDYVSRNDSLSEEGIYKESLGLLDAKKVTVLSGSLENLYGYYPFKKNIHAIYDKPCLQVITRGRAGEIRFLPKGNYATNTNSMLLFIKDSVKKVLGIMNEQDEEEYLKFLEMYLQPFFREFCSSADLSVFPLSEAIEKIKIPALRLNSDIRKIANLSATIKNYRETIKSVLLKLQQTMSREIAY